MCLQSLQVFIEAVKAGFPHLTVLFNPVGRFFERQGLEFSWPPLRVTRARNQASFFQNFQVPGDGRGGHFERAGEFADRGLTQRKPSQNRPACGVGKC